MHPKHYGKRPRLGLPSFTTAILLQNPPDVKHLSAYFSNIFSASSGRTADPVVSCSERPSAAPLRSATEVSRPHDASAAESRKSHNGIPPWAGKTRGYQGTRVVSQSSLWSTGVPVASETSSPPSWKACSAHMGHHVARALAPVGRQSLARSFSSEE